MGGEREACALKTKQRFAKEYSDKPESIHLTNRSTTEWSGHNQNCRVWRKANTAYQEKNLVVEMWGTWMTPYYPGILTRISCHLAAGLEIVYATRQQPKAFQQNYRGIENEGSYSALAQSKFAPQSNRNVVVRPETGGTCQMSLQSLSTGWVQRGRVGRNPKKQMREAG